MAIVKTSDRQIIYRKRKHGLLDIIVQVRGCVRSPDCSNRRGDRLTFIYALQLCCVKNKWIQNYIRNEVKTEL